MMLGSCSRDKEVRESMRLGHWPEACSAELRSHVAICHACSDFLLVSQTILQAKADSAAIVGFDRVGTSLSRLPSPGLVWWRAQLRRRNEAVARIGRPIFGAQVFAIAANLVVVIAVITWQSREGSRWSSIPWLSHFTEFFQSPAFHLDSLWKVAAPGSSWNWLALLPCLAVLALLSGVVLYLAAEPA